MEVEKFASKGVAGAGLGLGIAGTALGLLNSNGNLLGGLFNNGCACGNAYTVCSENVPVNRYELAQEQKIAELQSQIALRDANTYGDQKLLELYKYVDGEFRSVRNELCDQKVFNATTSATVSCLSGQVGCMQNLLNSITKTVVPNSAICPGWGDVTVAITPTTTTAAGA